MPKTDTIKIELIKLGGRTYLDIRRCLRTPGGLVPTSRGLSIEQDQVPELLKRIQNANGKPEYIDLS